MRPLKIVAYTDIHHSAYTNGLTAADAVAVERQVLDIAVEHQADLIVFCGDRFRERNPIDEVKTAADAEIKRKSDAGFPQAILVGNHDRWTRSPESGHTFKFTEHWQKELPLVMVLDDRRAYRLRLPDGRTVALHAIPADHELSVAPLSPDTGADYNICLFHSLILGSLLQNGVQAQEGMSLGDLDLPWLDLVLGGDNHRRQRLGTVNTEAWYLGAAMQHGWGDCGEERGISVFEVSKGGIEQQFIPSCAPKFVKYSIPWAGEEQLGAFFKYTRGSTEGNIVRVSLTGSAQELSGVDLQKLGTLAREMSGARQVRVLLDPDTPTSVAQPKPVSGEPADDFAAFMESGVAQTSALDPARLTELALKILSEVTE